MVDIATVTLKIADVEPIASFIARVCKADALIRRMTVQDAEGLPGTVVAGIQEFQAAVQDLGVSLPYGGRGAGDAP